MRKNHRYPPYLTIHKKCPTIDDKLNPERLYFVEDTNMILDPSYEYHENLEKTLTVRIHGNEILWFYNGFEVNGTSTPVPSDLQQYEPSSSVTGCTYTDATGETTFPIGAGNGWIGTYQHTIRIWNNGYGGNLSGTVYAIVNASGGMGQNLGYHSPYVYNEETVYRIYYMNKAYS